jgi:hypothetical protein
VKRTRRSSLLLRTAVCSLGLALLTGCGDDAAERFGAGFDDGFEAGYESACDPDVEAIEEEFDDAEYARGYAAGVVQGANRCARDQRAGRTR